MSVVHWCKRSVVEVIENTYDLNYLGNTIQKQVTVGTGLKVLILRRSTEWVLDRQGKNKGLSTALLPNGI